MTFLASHFELLLHTAETSLYWQQKVEVDFVHMKNSRGRAQAWSECAMQPSRLRDTMSSAPSPLESAFLFLATHAFIMTSPHSHIASIFHVIHSQEKRMESDPFLYNFTYIKWGKTVHCDPHIREYWQVL